ncbi:hypothetical protein L6164_032797 [Bauhinia variegata]|uniref:Uncharacterized protein n=1 Tax=Bauhinia variegata TaxID=167791 RepID=A0ACB9KQ32_BAUVA|nr:hypothetical protein L6164_032797 [Bauhinia variegata]
MTMINNNNNVNGVDGDTTLTKVFVGGLAWETPTEAMKQHFDKFGEILEAVIIYDKLSGRSKGYGFVTFKDPDAAKKACQDPAPIINGRRANCNLASLGSRRQRSSTNSPPRQQPGSNGGPRKVPAAAPAANHVPWYFPVGTPASPFHRQHQPLPVYGYTPTYFATDINYNQKMNFNGGGAYVNAHCYPSQAIVGANRAMPTYPHPFYQYHETHAMGVPAPAHVFQPITAGHFTTVPAFVSKPASITPTTGECFKKVC